MKLLSLIKYILLVTFSVLFFDNIVSYTFESIIGNRYDKVLSSTYQAKSEVAVLGASRALHHYIPKIIQDSLHMTVTNYGIDGQNIFVHFVVLKSLLEHSLQKPKIVILELSAIDVNDTPKWNEEKLSLLYPYFRSENYVQVVLEDLVDSKEYYFLRMFGLYRHNSKFHIYLKNILFGFPLGDDGYHPLYNRWKQNVGVSKEHGERIHNKKVSYIKEIIRLCRKENILLFFSTSPNYTILPDQKWVAEVRNISQRYNIPYLYFEQDNIFLKNRELFNDPFHLNDLGAHIYTSQFCHELCKYLKFKRRETVNSPF